VFGPNGSGDAAGTWIILMFLGSLGCAGGGILAATGRWRRWYRPVDSPIRYAPLAAIPFGLGCLIELVATLFPLPTGPRQVTVVALFVCLMLSGLLFLYFPAQLRPAWIQELDALQKKETTDSKPIASRGGRKS